VAAPKYPERATVLLCAAVRCCALRVLGIKRHAHPLHDFTPSWLAAEGLPLKFSPCKISSKHKQQSRFRAAAARAGHGHLHRRIASSAAGELNLSTAGFCFRSSTSSATGLNPSSFCRAFRMRRVGSHTGRSSEFCERTRTDKCAKHAWNESKAHQRSSRGSTIAAEAFISHAPQPRLPRAATTRATMVSRAATARATMVHDFPSSPRGQRWCVGFVSSRRAQVLTCLFLSLDWTRQAVGQQHPSPMCWK